MTRYRVPQERAREFTVRARSALDVLSARVGYVDGLVGRNVDEPDLWTITMRWRDVGSYRRALSAMEVKAAVVPLLSESLDEPSAYELDPDL